MKNKPKTGQVLIVGLGRFGQSLARALVAGGVEVMAMDAREDAAEEISDEVPHVMIADSTEEHVLREVGPEQFDLVVCAIGGDIQASIMTTLLLKEMGAKKLIAKASTALHGRALAKLGVDRVVYPEREIAQRLAQDVMAPNITELVHLTVTQSMFEMPAPGQVADRFESAGEVRLQHFGHQTRRGDPGLSQSDGGDLSRRYLVDPGESGTSRRHHRPLG